MKPIAVLLLVSCLSVAYGQTILEVVRSRPELSTLSGVLSSPAYAQIAQILSAPGSRTLFAPTNEAFAALGGRFDPSQVRPVSGLLLYHILPTRLTSGEMRSRGHLFAPTLLNDPAIVNLGAGRSQVMQIRANGGAFKVVFGIAGSPRWEADVIATDIPASNGVVHVVNRVILVPQSASTAGREAGGFTALLDNLAANNLMGIADNTPGLTIWAPTNAAFDRFASLVHSPDGTAIDRTATARAQLTPSLLYSPQLRSGQTLPTLANGRTVTVTRNGNDIRVNGVPVQTTDVLLKNGVVHIVTDVNPIKK